MLVSPMIQSVPHSKSAMENQPSNRRKAMKEELVEGRDAANQLLEILVCKSNTHHEGVEGLVLPFAEDLIRKVLRSFTNTLLLLNTHNDGSDEEVMYTTIKNVSSSVKCTNPEDKNESCKGFFNAKRRRGCHKRNAPTWEKDSSILMEDGYVWRKYGQKMTMNAKYLRSYYRCTHKYNEGCPAIKHVQRIQEDPPLYRTTYYGHHNCKTSLSSEIMLESAFSSDSSMFLSFSDTFPIKDHSFSSMKEEPMEVIPEDYGVHNQLPSSDNYLLLCDYGHDYNYSRHDTKPSSSESVQFDEVYGSSLDFYG
ncbi:hypothetical protein Fmac_018904 [Flemingia macrophylla]|uniref:WRKY domain-containing protein n=1 Tax=Flemingia macrophylla TaxID=520843 RepID=A0ABD1M6Z8_9FABA